MNDLKWASIGFYALGIIDLLAACVLFVLFKTGSISGELPLWIALLLLIKASLIMHAGYSFQKRKNWVLCYFASILIMPIAPFGTGLGIYGIDTLNANKDLFY